VVGDLFWAPIKLQQGHHVLPVLRGKVEPPTFSFSPSARIAMSNFGPVGGVAVTAVTGELAANGAGRAVQSPGDLCAGNATNQKSGNGVPFLLRELRIAHV